MFRTETTEFVVQSELFTHARIPKYGSRRGTPMLAMSAHNCPHSADLDHDRGSIVILDRHRGGRGALSHEGRACNYSRIDAPRPSRVHA